jgi:hypothetical protein
MKYIKKFNEMQNTDLRTKLAGMSYVQITNFLRSIQAFGESDFVDKFSYKSLNDIIKDAVNDGYDVKVSIKKGETAHIFVKYIRSTYTNSCEIIGLGGDIIDSLPFDFNKIAADYPSI